MHTTQTLIGWNGVVAPTRPPAEPASPDRKELFRLEDFAVGPCNRVTYLAACKVRDGDDAISNPLFIYGRAGVGKTHLIQGLCRSFRTRRPGAQVEQVSGEQFSNIFRERLRKGEIGEFRSRFRRLDLLVVDDVQSLAGKTATQAEFLYTFEELHRRGHPIVLAADRHPKEMHALQPSLTGRFLAGFVVRLDPPDPDTRLEILRGRCRLLGCPVDDEILHLVAQELPGNVREMVGALTQITAHASLCHETIDVPTARAILDEFRSKHPSQVTFRNIERIVTRYFGIRSSDLRSRSKKRAMALPRQIAMYFARKLGKYSLKEIGDRYGGKSHTTVTHSEGRVRQLMEKDASIRRTVDLLEAELTQ